MKKTASTIIIAILILSVGFIFTHFKDNSEPKVNIKMIEDFISENYKQNENYKVTYKDFQIIIKNDSLKDDSVRTIITEIPYSIKGDKIILDEENKNTLYICQEGRGQQIPAKELCK